MEIVVDEEMVRWYHEQVLVMNLLALTEFVIIVLILLYILLELVNRWWQLQEGSTNPDYHHWPLPTWCLVPVFHRPRPPLLRSLL